MPTPNEVKNQINGLISRLLEKSLVKDQRFAIRRPERRGRYVEITFCGAESVSIALKNIPYSEIYDRLIKAKAYNLKLRDGGLIQMMYTFENGTLVSHRLAFFSPPRLDEVQNAPEIYPDDADEDDDAPNDANEKEDADAVARNTVAFPIRFDYNARDDTHKEITHPKSHLTLGQYQSCRIPVTAPLTPEHFMDFILRNFYYPDFAQFVGESPSFSGSFADSILQYCNLNAALSILRYHNDRSQSANPFHSRASQASHPAQTPRLSAGKSLCQTSMPATLLRRLLWWVAMPYATALGQGADAIFCKK